MDSLVKSWQEFLSGERNFSNHTVSAYIIDLNYFLEFISNHHSSNSSVELLEKLSLQDFRAWLAYRKRENFAFSSTTRAIAAVKNFFKYLIRFHNLTNKAIFNLKSPKLPASLPKALNEEQTFLALQSSLEIANEPWIALRDQALLYLIYGCGLRISEALSIKVKDLSSKMLIVRGKGNKERMVPIIETIVIHIKQYLEICPYALSDNDFIFVGKQGEQLNPGVFQRQIRHLRNQLNLPETTTPHAFRHSFATHILANGGDLKSIQELLGHQDLTTTQKYTKVDAKHLLDVYNKAHPHGGGSSN
jgi:integrase/recombinase XerC